MEERWKREEGQPTASSAGGVHEMDVKHDVQLDSLFRHGAYTSDDAVALLSADNDAAEPPEVNCMECWRV